MFEPDLPTPGTDTHTHTHAKLGSTVFDSQCRNMWLEVKEGPEESNRDAKRQTGGGENRKKRKGIDKQRAIILL